MKLHELYGFARPPFGPGLPAKDLFPSRGHQEAQSRLAFALENDLSVLLTGDVGSGKSTAARAFVAGLDANAHQVIYLSNPHLSPQLLYRQLLLELCEEPGYSLAYLVPHLQAALRETVRKGRFPLLVVDEADRLPQRILDQLRFLLNAEMDSTSLLQLVLLGHPELGTRLRFAPYEALYQRLGVRYHLPPMDLAETAQYVKHHLRVAGGPENLFSEGFLAGVYEHTKGIPRQVNTVCRNALVYGAAQDRQVLDEADLRQVLFDLRGGQP